MKKLRLKYSLPQLCRVLNVSASGYYSWVDRPLSRWASEEARLEIEIKAVHRQNRGVCGAEKLQCDLAERGIKVGICRIKRIKRKLGIRCKQKKKFKATTNSNHKLPVAENILRQQFKVESPDKVWVSDITYISTDEGWLYLAGHKDLCTGSIVGYAMGERITKNLVEESLIRAI
jgi:putative transposase